MTPCWKSTPETNSASKPGVDPLGEGHPEPFSQPRTIPGAWDLSGLIDPPHASTPLADMNGTAYEQNNPVFTGKKHDKATNTVR